MKQTTIQRLRQNYNYGDPKAEHHYCQSYDISFFRDDKLNRNAKLVLAYLLSNSDTYTNTIDLIVYNLKIGRDSVKSALKNLETEKYLYRKPVSCGKNSIVYQWIISAYRDDSLPNSKHNDNLPTIRQTENQSGDNQSFNLRQTENQSTENQSTENQSTENQSAYNNNKIINNEISINKTDNHCDTSTKSLDSSSSPEGSIRNSENFATQNVPQPENVIFEKIKAESKVLMKDLPQPKLKLISEIEIENEINKLNESEKDMIINNEYINEDEFNFVDTTANLKIENENLKLDSDTISTASTECSVEENINNINYSVHSEIDVITPIIEKTPEQKYNESIADAGIALFSDGLYSGKDDMDALIDEAFPDARKKLISNTDIADTEDWKPIGKIDTAKLKANADKYLNTGFKNTTSFDPTLDF